MKCKICLKNFGRLIASTVPLILICDDCVKKEREKLD